MFYYAYLSCLKNYEFVYTKNIFEHCERVQGGRVIKVIFEGEVSPRKASSVTLIETSEHCILVDTSSKEVEDIIVAELAEIGLSMEDIDAVINTHLHPDHTGNNDLFRKATVYASPNECVEKYDGRLVYPDRYAKFTFTPVKEFEDEEIQVMNTPGHTWGSISVVYGDCIIVGDAAPTKKNLLEDLIPECVDYLAAKGSLKRIKMLGKNVVTGHEGIIHAHELQSSLQESCF